MPHTYKQAMPNVRLLPAINLELTLQSNLWLKLSSFLFSMQSELIFIHFQPKAYQTIISQANVFGFINEQSKVGNKQYSVENIAQVKSDSNRLLASMRICNYKMQAIFHKFIEISANKPPQAALFLQFAYMQQQIRKSFKQLKDSKGVAKPNEDFMDYWKQIGSSNRDDQVAIYFRWIQLLQKSLTNFTHRQFEDKQSTFYVKKSMISKWDIRKVKLNGLDLQIFSKKLKIFPLKCFCIRKSKNKDHFSWVMQVIMQIDDSKFKSFHLGTNNITEYQQWFRQVQARIDLARIQYFKQAIGSQAKLKMVSKNTNEEKLKEEKKIEPQKKQMTKSQEIRLKTKTLTQILIHKQLNQIQDNYGLSVIQDNETQEAPEVVIHPNIYIRLFTNSQISNFCENPANGTLLECQKQYRLYELNGRIKMFITMNSSVQIVFRAISQSHGDWNPQINNFTIKNKISSQNSALIYQKYKSKGFLYKERDYFFLRHCFTVEAQSQKQRIFMIQKSIDSIHHPPFMTVTRGEMELIWCIVGQKEDKQCLLIVQGLIKGGGYMNINEDKETTIKNFKMLLQLDNYLKQIKYTKTSNDGYLFKEKWLVSFKTEQQDEFYSPREIQSDEFETNKIQQMKQQKKNSADMTQENQESPKKKKESEYLQFIKHTSNQEHKQHSQQNKKQHIYAPSIQNFNQEYTPPQFNADRSIKIPNKFITKKHQLQPRPKGQEIFAQKIRGHHLWKGQWDVAESGGLLYVDQQKMKAQKKVLTFIIKRIGKNIFSGKGILNISLPVDIFCRESNIQRLALSFGYCPIYLQKVVDGNAMQQLKAVVASIIGSSLIYLTMEKPFNPILGETYTCWIDGCPVYFEQIAHHPPIAAYLMKGRGYDVYGSIQAKMELSINSGTGINEGIFTVSFHNGRKFHFTTPPGELCGLTYGERKLYLVQKTYFWSMQEGIFLQLTYNPMAKESRFFGSGRNYVGQEKLQDYFEGIIRKYKPEDLKEFLTPKKNDMRKMMAIPKSLPPQEPISTHSKVHGRWTKHIYFGDQKIFDADSCKYLKGYDEKNPLPSHSNYRQDVVYRRLNQFVLAQEWKEILQVKQRKDRKLREDFLKKKGK